ncbi:MAG: hypothetical protein JWO30_874 [Fibrobacteres bacterium]|nr:hypothetical protein [Fibrobacterota bacterium]
MRFKLLSALLGMAMFAGCFSTEEQSTVGNGKTTGNDSTKIVYVLDSILLAQKLDSLQRVNDSLRLAVAKNDSLKNGTHTGIGGWDDFPNKYKPTLIELANKMRQLPMPMGTRYSVQPKIVPPLGSFSKAAAAQACTGISEIAGLRFSDNTIYGLDTISYYDSKNLPHCDWQNPTTRETHARHMINDASGEVWEKIDIQILDDNTLPNYLTHATGRMLLNNGMKINIDSYDVDAMVIYGDSTVNVRSASLQLSWQNGYSFKMDLAKARPFKVVDLFPIWGGNPSLGKILSGPILHPGTAAGAVDTLGFIDLYSDHTVAIRDWTGTLVQPTP